MSVIPLMNKGDVGCCNDTRAEHQAEKPEMAWGIRGLCATGGGVQTMVMVQVCCLNPAFPFMPAPPALPAGEATG